MLHSPAALLVLPRLALEREGSTNIYVPAESLSGKDPATFPAFFNPAARVNRDVSVAIAAETRPTSFLDALAGVGARGVRIANEVSGVRATLVEFNRVSLAIARKNVARNHLATRCDLVHQECNAFLFSRFGRPERFTAVDVDPFGTPAPYALGALTAASDEAIVSVTATDTATLCGVYPVVAERRYGVRLVKTESPHETAIRALLGFFARVGGMVDIGVRPVAAHSTLHYLRVYFRVARGASASDASIRQLGYVSTCTSCHERYATRDPSPACPRCGAKSMSVGPIWTGPLVDERVVEGATGHCERSGWDRASAVLGSLKGLDRYPPFAFSLEALTSREGISSVKFARIVDCLSRVGKSAMRQPFGSGLKTDASYSEVRSAVKASG
jgi:tRNA (guanine26-N2/guanine27-N2)-dimethyltransferase